MSDSYVESLTESASKIFLGDKYSDKYWYQLVTDTDGSYIRGVDKETGECVGIYEDNDVALDVESFDTDFVPELDNITVPTSRFTVFQKCLMVVSALEFCILMLEVISWVGDFV